jgi:cytochrome c oxidase cbb3-type subunit 3
VSEKKKPDEVKVLPHEYDGIRELDNNLPSWWLASFYLTILFAPLYIGWYHYGPGLSLREEMDRDVAALHEQAAAARGAEPSGPSEEALLAIFNDPAQRAAGQAKFESTCASCHGAHGEGGIGPNLTDNYWLHGKGSLSDLVAIVGEGVPEKGMPPWKGLLKPDELKAVVAYVKSLHGSKPAGAKAPQGEEVKD